MAIRTKLLSGRNINTDSDFSKYIETVSEPWVIEGLVVSSWKVATGKCWVPCDRTNWETIYALVENFTEVSITTSWKTWFVIVSIPQNYIDDWTLINEDWTGVATFEVVTEKPTKNALVLASLKNGAITDERNLIKKVGELNTAIESLSSKVKNIDSRVQELEEAGAIDHLEEQALVWELYTLDDTLFRQLTPALGDSTVEQNVWDVAANTEIHIQRLGSGTASNKLKLKMKMSWSPTTAVKVEVREWVQVTVTENSEAYWYWDDSKVLATWSLAYSNFSTDWKEVEFDLSASVWGVKWQLLDIVVYQESSGSKVVNASNFYIMGCDSTQWSEWFSLVCVNGTTRTRSKLMPYCVSDWFAQSLLCKVSTQTYSVWGVAIYKADTIENSKPLEKKEIWFVASVTLFGKHSDWTTVVFNQEFRILNQWNEDFSPSDNWDTNYTMKYNWLASFSKSSSNWSSGVYLNWKSMGYYDKVVWSTSFFFWKWDTICIYKYNTTVRMSCQYFDIVS